MPRSPISAVLAVLAALCSALPIAAQTDEDFARRIDRWFRYWKAGKIQLEATIDEPRLAERFYGEGIVPPRAARPLRHRDALALLVGRTRPHQTRAVTCALLELAAVGLHGKPVDPELSPQAVRRIAHEVLASFDTAAAIDTLAAATLPDQHDPAVRAAALLALGSVRPPVARIFVERQLNDPERVVRLAAAEALGTRAHPGSVDDLGDRLAQEDDAVVLQAIVFALHWILTEHGAAVAPTEARRATSIAIDAVGRGDWRSDVAIVDLLHDVRTAHAIPTLIGILERFHGRRGSKTDSTILRDRTHRALQSLTGTRLPADDAAAWRAFWERERDGFAVAPRLERRADHGATSTGFFGIPIRGNRIVFVIDVSGSMSTRLGPLGNRTSDRNGKTATRLTWAKRELRNAVEGLPSDARFGVVVFSTGVHRWNSRLVAPSPASRHSLRQMLAGLEPRGATNLWGAIDDALGISDAAWGQVEDDGVDEVFLLTDGMPSAGDITAPDAIVEAVREANRYRRARIHAVSLGGDAAFLRRLAEENSGSFVKR